MSEHLSSYLNDLRSIRATGAATDELSYYGPLRTLLNSVGEALSPGVVCVMNVKNQGAGLPDGGLFTQEQLPTDSVPLEAEVLQQTQPVRGVIEVKPPDHSLDELQHSEQVERYLRSYRLVLITNYRDFRLLKQGARDPEVLEHFTLAEEADAFWGLVNRYDEIEDGLAERFKGFIDRVLTRNAPLLDPKDVAHWLASYARDAKLRLGNVALDDLKRLREALEEALGIKFRGERGERFFRSTVIQTLFYGLFSAWVLWHREDPMRRDEFNWKEASEYLRVPVIRRLFYQLVAPQQLRKLRLMELMNWTGDALNRVDRPSFFSKFEEAHAVQYFYEPFLQAFDPELRKELGVWYTPPEVVQYMVRRVDAVLKEELHIEDGLADENVMVLDPCCGTGAYLVETLRLIDETHEARGEGALRGALLKKAATDRVFGFEILTAPFVVAHLQVGLFLAEMGVPLTDDDKNDRAGIYLTNALTGWDPAEEPQTLLFNELEEERDQADAIKQGEKILVVLGNPPYDGFPGMAIGEEKKLSAAYRATNRGPEPRGHGLNDLYVRFYRMAERQIVEHTGRGIVCYISNYSWLDGLSHPGMRERYLEAFDRIWIDNLNGDKYRTGKTTPEGKPDPSIFSTEYNRVGIQVGTAVVLLARTDTINETATVQYRDFWGSTKRSDLISAVLNGQNFAYKAIDTIPELGYPFLPRDTAEKYLNWPKLPAIFPDYFPGVQTKRDDLVVDIDIDPLLERMRTYFDPEVSDAEMKAKCARALKETNRFSAAETRRYLVRRGLLEDNFVRYLYRPMDVRWVYYEPETRLLGEKVPDYFPQSFSRNPFIFTTPRTRKPNIEPAQYTRVLTDLNCLDSGASGFPLYINPEANGGDLFSQLQTDGQEGEPIPNLSDDAKAYLDRLYPPSTQPSTPPHENLFYHTLAVLHAPSYRTENAGALRQDWPRVPLPETREALEESAAIGREVAGLLDVEQQVPGVTSGSIREELRPIGTPQHVEPDGQLNPDEDFSVTAGWGYVGHHGATMPGGGTYDERAFDPDEEAALPDGATERWGASTFDIYLNDAAYWQNIPERVWAYTLGGYPVIKKWLSYRDEKVLGRPLKLDEVRHVTHMARRIAALLLLEPRLDANYERVKGDT